MKLLVIGSKARLEKYKPDLPVTSELDVVVVPLGTDDESILELAGDADFIMADAIAPVSAHLIDSMPNLRLVHSEGVAFDKFDLKAAARRGVFVCNNRGVNAIAVAEQTLLLMLGLCKHLRAGDRAVREGRQIELKETLMVQGIAELCGSRVGLVGFGDIAREVARLCLAFGTEVTYTKRLPLDKTVEEALEVRYMPLDELLGTSDFVSLHVPVTPETTGMADGEFFAKMRDGSYFINTARGELVDNDACVDAIVSGKLAGAGFDTLAPEPVRCDNPLLNLPEAYQDRVLFSPHIGGVTTNVFYRAHRGIWENIARVAKGEAPINVVSR